MQTQLKKLQLKIYLKDTKEKSMSNFNYSQYQDTIARAQASSTNQAVKVGFFKLKNDKDEALIRINVSTMDDLQFATVHQLGAAQKWMKIGCLNPVGSYSDNCPLCSRVAAGDTSIGKASKKVYVQMLVSYKDPVTNQFSAAIPVIWERPAGFSREIANLLRDYGNLKERVFKVTRNGAAGSMQTTYSISYIPLYDKPEAVSTDFSPFTNFNIAKHSYWEKSVEDINTFLTTGSFPEVVKAQEGAYVAPTAFSAPAQPTYTAPAAPVYQAPVNPTPVAQPAYQAPVTPAPQAPVTPAAQPTATPVTDRPARNFGGFSF
jgi:hypothetical protein